MDRRMDGWMNGLLCACLISIVTACNVCVSCCFLENNKIVDTTTCFVIIILFINIKGKVKNIIIEYNVAHIAKHEDFYVLNIDTTTLLAKRSNPTCSAQVVRSCFLWPVYPLRFTIDFVLSRAPLSVMCVLRNTSLHSHGC